MNFFFFFLCQTRLRNLLSAFFILFTVLCQFFPSPRRLQGKIYLYRCPWWRRLLHCCLASETRPLQCQGAKTSSVLFLCLVALGRRCRLQLLPCEQNILIRQPPHPGEKYFFTPIFTNSFYFREQGFPGIRTHSLTGPRLPL